MSMNATDEVVSSSATFLATVDFPDPLPPAIPIINGSNIVFERYEMDVGNALCPFASHLKLCADAGSQMKIRSIVFALLVLGASACNAFSRGSGSSDQNQPTIVQVDNQGYLDMTVYAARSSQRVRLGTATGNSKSNFTIPSFLMSGLTTLRFVADPIGGRRASVSEEITITPGDTVVLTIPPV
jgi:hypothetical protein